MTIKGIKKRFARDAQALRELKGRRKLYFIWDYYKIPVISVLSVAVLLLLSAAFSIGRGDIAMYAVLVNANEEVESTVLDDLLSRSGMDLEGKTVQVTASYKLGQDYSEAYDVQTLQVLAAEFAIGDLDLFAADESVFQSYAEKDAFVDLSLFIETELLDQHQENLYIYENEDGYSIVGGIWLREGSPLHQAGYYSADVLLGVVANAQNLDEALAVAHQLVREMDS